MSKEVDMASVRDAFESLECVCMEAHMGCEELELLRTTVRTLRAEVEEMRKDFGDMLKVEDQSDKHWRAISESLGGIALGGVDTDDTNKKGSNAMECIKRINELRATISNYQASGVLMIAQQVKDSSEIFSLKMKLDAALKERHPSHVHCVTPCDSIRLQEQNHMAYLEKSDEARFLGMSLRECEEKLRVERVSVGSLQSAFKKVCAEKEALLLEMKQCKSEKDDAIETMIDRTKKCAKLLCKIEEFCLARDAHCKNCMGPCCQCALAGLIFPQKEGD